MIRRRLRTVVDPLLRAFDLKLVNRFRAPRGFSDAFQRIANSGIGIKHIFDVGASDGQWTRSCLKVFPDARYFLVEARHTHEAALATFRQQQPNIDYTICTLGAQTKNAEIYEHGNQTSVLASEYVDSPQTNRTTVELQTLDMLIAPEQLTGPTIIKLDVQGYELEVLRGGEQLLSTDHVQFLLAEVSMRRIYDSAPLAHEVIRFAADHGFRIFDICSYCPRPHDLELAQCDVLFAKNTSSLFEYEGWN
ncbi:MAG: FkbM family methyltransferase [Planctomycetota bacterium]|nr:FkbM family methyltransferase [Planctomycetota bacterium]